MEYEEGRGGWLKLIVEVFVEPDAGLEYSFVATSCRPRHLQPGAHPCWLPRPREIDSGICS